MKMKNENGITIITLAITVIILVIITGALTSKASVSLQASRLTKLQNDIEVLNDRVAAYYVEYGELPLYGSAVDATSITNKSRK